MFRLHQSKQVPGLANDTIRYRFLTILIHQSLVNGKLLSHGTFVLTSQRTARDWSYNFAGRWNASIQITNDFRLSPTQNKLPALHSDNTVYFCCKTIPLLTVSYGWAEAIFTQENKCQSQNIFFVHQTAHFTKRFIQENATGRHNFFVSENISVF